MRGEAITARGLVKQYGERAVVDGLDLEVWPGEIVGLLGPNGAGKTTTFNMIVGAIRPTHGSVFLGEREITELPMFRRARLGVVYLPQETSVFRKLSVADNLNAILETIEPSAAKRKERREALLSEFGLTEKARQRAIRSPAESGGASRSRGHWCCRRSSCCSTNHSPASTRSPRTRSRRSSTDSSRRASGS
jgi:lipopolysaccharide export system ATP-binding protein